MKSLVLLLACSCAIAAVSCKKNKQNPAPQPPVTNETVKVRLRLTGDILTSETTLPNGRKADTNTPFAKTLRDSTLYTVMIKKGRQVISSGIFSHPDSISMEIPFEGEVTIVATAFKKGSGAGINYTWQNGQRYYDYPFYNTVNNRMDTSYIGRRMRDTLSMSLTYPLDTNQNVNFKGFPEIDAYRGEKSYTAAGVPAIVSINLKRLAFGIQFASPNFTTGKLIAEFHGVGMLPSVTPANINSSIFIYSAHQFKEADEMGYSVDVTMKWEKPDGTVVPLGMKSIKFKRNVLTKIQVTIVDNGKIDLDPIITETNWSNTEIIDL